MSSISKSPRRLARERIKVKGFKDDTKAHFMENARSFLASLPASDFKVEALTLADDGWANTFADIIEVALNFRGYYVSFAMLKDSRMIQEGSWMIRNAFPCCGNELITFFSDDFSVKKNHKNVSVYTCRRCEEAWSIRTDENDLRHRQFSFNPDDLHSRETLNSYVFKHLEFNIVNVNTLQLHLDAVAVVDFLSLLLKSSEKWNETAWEL